MSASIEFICTAPEHDGGCRSGSILTSIDGAWARCAAGMPGSACSWIRIPPTRLELLVAPPVASLPDEVVVGD